MSGRGTVSGPDPGDPAIGPASTPAIGRGFRLQWEAAQDAHVLLYPEGMIKLNGSAGEILKRCDGAATIADIAELRHQCEIGKLLSDLQIDLE